MTSWLLERWNQVEHWIRQGIATTPDAVLIAAAVIGAVVVLFVLRRLRVGLAGLWDHLGASFWFVPGLMMAGAVVLSIVMVELDTLVHSRVGGKIVWLWEGGAEAARVMLGTIASSMITIAGVVFSITMVVLSLISGQFGPRLMRNFREDKSNQLVLGTFIATFVYCLMVLRKVTNGPGADFVPYLAIGLSIVLALINVGVIIYFIHHIAVMSQATYIVDLVSEDLARSIDMIFPEEIGEEMAAGHEEPVMDLEEFDRRALSVAAERKGYLQAIEAEKLMALAKDNDLVIHAHYRPGDFIVEATPLVSIQAKNQIDDRLCGKIRSVFLIGKERTPRQDVEFGVRQLVEIAVRALSPGINDPFTAITCVDHLGAALCRAARRHIPSRYRYDNENKLRVIADAVTFEGLIEASFNQIRQYGQSSVAVSIRLLETLTLIAKCLARQADSIALHLQAQTIRDASENYSALDRRAVEARYRAFMRAWEETNLRLGEAGAQHQVASGGVR